MADRNDRTDRTDNLRTEIPHNHKDQDDAEVLHALRDLRAGQRQSNGVLQQLAVALQRLGTPRRPSPHSDDDRSDAGSRRAPRTTSWTAVRPTRPTFVRQEPDEAVAGEAHEGLFAGALRAANDEWELVPPEARERITIDRTPQNKEEEVISMFKEYSALPRKIKKELPFMSYMDLHPSLCHKTEFARKKYLTIAHELFTHERDRESTYKDDTTLHQNDLVSSNSYEVCRKLCDEFDRRADLIQVNTSTALGNDLPTSSLQEVT